LRIGFAASHEDRLAPHTEPLATRLLLREEIGLQLYTVVLGGARGIDSSEALAQENEGYVFVL